jgi:hypothetical protein
MNRHAEPPRPSNGIIIDPRSLVMSIGGSTTTDGDDVIFVPNANETIDGRGGEGTVDFRALASGATERP